MRLDPVFESFYVLGSLWTGLAGPQGCPASPPDWPRAAYAAAGTPRPVVSAGVTAFVNVNVVPMDTERVLPNQTVLVEGGRITALGPASQIKVPAGAVQIDGRGQYLMPGLGEMHALHGPPSTEQQRRNHQNHISPWLADGVTMVRLAAAGEKQHIDSVDKDKVPSAPPTLEQVRRPYQDSTVLLPRIYMSPPLRRPAGLIPRDSLVAYLTAAKAAGYRHVGVLVERYPYKRDPQTTSYFTAVVAAARQLDLPVATHTHRLLPEEILALGSTGGSIEHIQMFYEEKDKQRLPDMSLETMRSIAAALRRAGMWVTPTLECHLRLSKPAVHPAMRQIVKTLQDEGVGLFLGVDTWGRSVHDELKALVRAGLTPYQALVTGTRNPAAFYKILDSAGTVAVGKRADLVLLYGNPLADIRHAREPAGVMLDGRWLDRAALDRVVFRSPKTWLEAALGLHPLDMPYTKDTNNVAHKALLQALADSLEAVAPSDRAAAAQLGQRFTAALGVMRTRLTPEEHEFFDPFARMWLREQARQGRPGTIPGVAPTPVAPTP
jgi:imidazolonepropionase-like amidohydrolase